MEDYLEKKYEKKMKKESSKFALTKWIFGMFKVITIVAKMFK